MSTVNNNDVFQEPPKVSSKNSKPGGRQRRVGHFSINQVYDTANNAQPKQRRHTHHTGPTPTDLAVVNSGEVSPTRSDLRKRVLIHQSSLNEQRKLQDIREEDWLRGGNQGKEPRTRAYSTPDTLARDAALKKYYIEKYAALKKNMKKEHAECASGSPLARSFSGHSAFLNNLDSHHLIIWRDKNRSTQVFKLPSTDEENDMEVEDLEANEDLVFAKFMRAHKCYDLIPTSSKLVVMDTKMNVKKAFYALVYNGVRAAPLFDSEKQDFVGMLTITDFIKILQKYYQSPLVKMGQLEDHLIETWREELESDQPLVYIDPDQSLFEAIKMLIQFRVHRLPVIDRYAGNALYILTHKRILRFLYLYIHDLPLPSFLNRTLEELNIGTYKDIATATMKTPLITAIDHFVSKRISALPIIDEEGCVVDLYAKFDVINLAAEKTYNNLDVTLKEAMKNRQDRQTGFQNVQTCRKTEKFKDIMERIVKAEVHRLIVVDVDRHVLGIVSLSDILSYLVLRPTNELQVPLMSPLSGKGDDDDTRL